MICALSALSLFAFDLFDRYALNIGFNLLNKTIFKYFPFPWTVSTVHVVVGLAYCALMYVLGFKGASFGRVSYTDSRLPNCLSMLV
jgi:Triose-phosphate Transporter family